MSVYIRESYQLECITNLKLRLDDSFDFGQYDRVISETVLHFVDTDAIVGPVALQLDASVLSILPGFELRIDWLTHGLDAAPTNILGMALHPVYPALNEIPSVDHTIVAIRNIFLTHVIGVAKGDAM